MPTPLDTCICIYFVRAGRLGDLLRLSGWHFVVTPAVVGELREPSRSQVLQAIHAGSLPLEVSTEDEVQLARSLTQVGAGPKLGPGEASVVAMVRTRRVVGVTEDQGAIRHLARDPGQDFWIGIRELVVRAVKNGSLTVQAADAWREDLLNLANCPRLDDFGSFSDLL